MTRYLFFQKLNIFKTHARTNNEKVLIVDEISMLDADTFDALEYVARSLRGVQAPFGGIRLVLSGDFFQAGDEKKQ